MNATELSEVLALHKKWLLGDDGKRANLRGADLGDANLRDANLRGADLRGAYLGGADLRDADLGGAYLGGAYLRGADLGDADLRDADLGDVLWSTYLDEVVPALLTAGGKTIEEVATPEVWACHSWRSDEIACPIGTAFNCSSLDGVPALYRQQAERFIQFFDQGLIPLPGTPDPESEEPSAHQGEGSDDG